MNTYRLEVETVSDSNVHGSACAFIKVTLLAYTSRHSCTYVADDQSEVRGVGERAEARALKDAIRKLRRQRWQERDLKRAAAELVRADIAAASAAFMSACGLTQAGQESRLWDLEISRAKSRAAYRSGKAKGIPAALVLAGGIQGWRPGQ
jgi:hypothetical protein